MCSFLRFIHHKMIPWQAQLTRYKVEDVSGWLVGVIDLAAVLGRRPLDALTMTCQSRLERPMPRARVVAAHASMTRFISKVCPLHRFLPPCHQKKFVMFCLEQPNFREKFRRRKRKQAITPAFFIVFGTQTQSEIHVSELTPAICVGKGKLQ